MGATDVLYFFEDSDAKVGIRKLQDHADTVIGHRGGYSGDINSIDSFREHFPSKKFNNPKDVQNYARDRMAYINKRCAEYINLGVVGYIIASPVIHSYTGSVKYNQAEVARVTAPAVLIGSDGRVVDWGSVEELKEKGKELVWRGRFTEDFLIIGKNMKSPLLVTSDIKRVKTTTRKSVSTTRVMPCYKFVVYGWAAS